MCAVYAIEHDKHPGLGFIDNLTFDADGFVASIQPSNCSAMPSRENVIGADLDERVDRIAQRWVRVGDPSTGGARRKRGRTASRRSDVHIAALGGRGAVSMPEVDADWMARRADAKNPRAARRVWAVP